MASIAKGLNKRGHKELYNGQYTKAVELFYRAAVMEPEQLDYIMDLIYGLNQNADYTRALEYCYALLGMEKPQSFDLAALYFFTAEAFGGIGSAECCAQMLERCLKESPEGPASNDAAAFLADLKERYTLGRYDASTNEVSMGMINGMAEAPFINYETAQCAGEVTPLAEEGNFKEAIARLEKEFEEGNFTVTLLSLGIMLGSETRDYAYMLQCAERFKFIEDYTIYELRALAYNMSILKKEDIAYILYRELYAQESGEKEIAFGFAVACERIGEIDHAKEIAQQLAAAEGNMGAATYYIEEIGKNTHSYLYRYEGKAVDIILDSYKKENLEAFYSDPKKIIEAADFMTFASPREMQDFFAIADCSHPLMELELRRLAINRNVSLFVRVQAAKILYDAEKILYFNTGTDIVVFTEELYAVLEKFLEKELHENDETTD